MTIKYKEFCGHGDCIDEARDFALAKVNDFVQEIYLPWNLIIDFNEEQIVSQSDVEPCVVYLHMYYISLEDEV